MSILSLRILDKLDEHISPTTLVRLESRSALGHSLLLGAEAPGFTRLYRVAHLGIMEIIATILERKERDVDSTDYWVLNRVSVPVRFY